MSQTCDMIFQGYMKDVLGCFFALVWIIAVAGKTHLRDNCQGLYWASSAT